MVGSAGTILGPALIALLGSSFAAHNVFLLAVGIVVAAVLAGLLFPGSRRVSKPGADQSLKSAPPTDPLSMGTDFELH